jgi:hypothetical protein
MAAFDISLFGGQTVDLNLRALGPVNPFQAGSSIIDSLTFTVPEPSTVALLTLAALALASNLRWFKRPRTLPASSE